MENAIEIMDLLAKLGSIAFVILAVFSKSDLTRQTALLWAILLQVVAI